MTQITEAVYTNGVLKPSGKLNLDEQQHVRIIIETVDERVDRETALARLEAGISNMQFRLKGRLPTRDELHDRG